jgi:hypothetical protein
LVRWDAGTIHDALTAIRFEFAERPRHLDPATVIRGADIHQFVAQKIHEIVVVILFALAILGLPLMEQLPDQIAKPHATLLIVLLSLAFGLLVIVALDDCRARDSAQPQGDNQIAGILRFKRHPFILSVARNLIVRMLRYWREYQQDSGDGG